MPTSTDTEIREALGPIREVEPTDAAVRRATLAARPRPKRTRRLRVALAAGALAAVATAVVAVMPSSDGERRSARDVLLSAAAVAAEQPAMPADGYRYARFVRRYTKSSMLRGCPTCVGSVTVEQEVEQWSPPAWSEGRRRYGDVRTVERSGDERQLRELTKGWLGFDSPRLVADPSLQDIPFAELPTNPTALRDLLQSAVLDLRWAGRARRDIEFERDALREATPVTREQTRGLLIDGVISILGDAHITPRLRSALFGVLATIDGARALGRVTDPLGRSGEGVAFDIDRDDAHVNYPVTEQRIVFDPDTSELLAVSSNQRNPDERPQVSPKVHEDSMGWYPESWTAYVQTGEVAKIGERP